MATNQKRVIELVKEVSNLKNTIKLKNKQLKNLKTGDLGKLVKKIEALKKELNSHELKISKIKEGYTFNKEGKLVMRLADKKQSIVWKVTKTFVFLIITAALTYVLVKLGMDGTLKSTLGL